MLASNTWFRDLLSHSVWWKVWKSRGRGSGPCLYHKSFWRPSNQSHDLQFICLLPCEGRLDSLIAEPLCLSPLSELTSVLSATHLNPPDVERHTVFIALLLILIIYHGQAWDGFTFRSHSSRGWESQGQGAKSVNCSWPNLAWGQPVSHHICSGLSSVCTCGELPLLRLPSLNSVPK